MAASRIGAVVLLLAGCASGPVTFDWDRPGGPGIEGWIRGREETYTPGDPVVILFRCYADAYVTAFVFGPEGEASLVFPNRLTDTNLRHGGKIAGVLYPDPDRSAKRRTFPIRVLLISARADIDWFEGYEVDESGDYPELKRHSLKRQRDFERHLAELLERQYRHSWSAAWLEFDGIEDPNADGLPE